MDHAGLQKSTKEAVSAELKLSDDPCETAAGVVRRTLAAALQAPLSATARELIVEDAVKGALAALFFADQDLTRGALLVVQASLDASAAWIDPAQAMGAALKGAADLLRFAAPTRLDEICSQIDARYMGAGDAFAEILRAPIHRTGLP